MAKFQINFAQTSAQRPTPFGVAWLVVGALAAFYALLTYTDASAEAERWQLRQARMASTARASGRASGASVPTAVNVALVRAAQQLDLPWSAWLQTLEAQTNASLAWSRLEAQGESRTFRLQGESKSLEDATGFVRRLQQAQWVESATLSEHDSGRGAQDGDAIQFSVEVHWKVKP